MSAALGKLDDALRQYRSIARDSAYFARAAPKIKDAERRLSAGILKEARVMARRGPPLKVHEKLKEALEADPENAEALKMMRDAEALMKKRRIKFEAWEPPMKTGDGQGGRNPDAVLIDKYPEDAIRRCVVMYYLGKADEALKELGRLLADRKNKDLEEQIETLQRGIFFVRGKFTEGQGHMFQNNVRDAARLWKMALEADAKLVPESPPSYYRDEISRLLAEAYLKAGTQMYGKERYEEAFGQWKAAYDIAPDHVEVLHALKKLESTAERMFEETVTGAMPPVEKREKFELIKAITLPKTSVHQMAIQKLLEMK
jgi:tetratricopeptide (TPR) repeat protein